MSGAFYESDGAAYLATASTRGPWDPQAQHAGPPAALLGREIERTVDPEGGQIGRITFEIVRPLPIGELRVSAEIVRPGRRVEMVEATLTDASGEELMRARAWRLRGSPIEAPQSSGDRIPGPAQGAEREYFPTGEQVGYHTAIEYRFLHGGFTEQGPATVWMRMRGELVAGEEPTPLQRVLVVADSGNGVSSALDWQRFSFVNVDLSVHLERLPAGDWVCLDAITLVQPGGTGTSDALLLDERGRIGRAMQTLLVSER